MTAGTRSVLYQPSYWQTSRNWRVVTCTKNADDSPASKSDLSSGATTFVTSRSTRIQIDTFSKAKLMLHHSVHLDKHTEAKLLIHHNVHLYKHTNTTTDYDANSQYSMQQRKKKKKKNAHKSDRTVRDGWTCLTKTLETIAAVDYIASKKHNVRSHSGLWSTEFRSQLDKNAADVWVSSG